MNGRNHWFNYSFILVFAVCYRPKLYSRNMYKILKERDHSKDLGIRGWIILRWIVGKIGFGYRFYSSCSGQQPMTGSCEHCVNPTGYMEVMKFLDQLSTLLASQVGLRYIESHVIFKVDIIIVYYLYVEHALKQCFFTGKNFHCNNIIPSVTNFYLKL